MSVAVAWSVESLPSNPRAEFDSQWARNLNFYPGTGCESFVCTLSSITRGSHDIVLITHSGRPAHVYGSGPKSVLLLQASHTRVVSAGV